MENEAFEFIKSDGRLEDVDDAAIESVVLPHLAINPNDDGIRGGGIDTIEIREDIDKAGVLLGEFIDSITLLPAPGPGSSTDDLL